MTDCTYLFISGTEFSGSLNAWDLQLYKFVLSSQLAFMNIMVVLYTCACSCSSVYKA